MATRNVSYLNSRGKRVNGILTTPDSGEKFPCVVLCSHFTGFKELKHLHAMSESFAQKGIASLRFDYSDCMGTLDVSCNDMTLTGYVLDLVSSLDFLDRQPEIDSTRLGAAGHSIGAATAIIGASRDSRINALVSVAALAKGEWEPLFDDNTIRAWKSKKYTIFNTPKKGNIKIGYIFYENLMEYDGTEDVKKVVVPICFIHGSADKLLPIKHSQALHKNAKNPKKLEKISGADHLFTKPEHEKKMIEVCTNWFVKYI